MKKAIAQMIQSLLLSLAARSQLQELREKLRPPAVDKGPVLKAKPPAAQKDILGVCCDPLVLAQQLTHIELVSAPHCPGRRPQSPPRGQGCCQPCPLHRATETLLATLVSQGAGFHPATGPLAVSTGQRVSLFAPGPRRTAALGV